MLIRHNLHTHTYVYEYVYECMRIYNRKITIGIILGIRIHTRGKKINYAQFMGLKICREEVICET